MASNDDEAPRTPENDDGDEEGEGDDEELNSEREVFLRHPSGVIIYKDEIPDLVAAGHIIFETTEASSSSSSSSSSSTASSSSSPRYRALFIADSGFGSVKLVVAGAKAGIAFICSVKQAHKFFPKAYITEQMKDAPSGSWLVLQSKIDGVDVVCAGYKYNYKKILFFCWPLGAASFVPGEPYIQRYQTETGAPATREVARLSVFSRYFMHSNLVDVHNEIRQHFLALEEKWVTTDCWFRVFTSLVGITLTDCFLAYKLELHDDHEDKNITMKEFADMAAHQMVSNKLSGSSGMSMATRRSPPKLTPSAIPVLSQSAEYHHRLEPLGRKPRKKDPTKDFQVQLTCAVCKGKASHFCAAVTCGKKIGGICAGTPTNQKNCLMKHISACFDAAVSSPCSNKRARTEAYV